MMMQSLRKDLKKAQEIGKRLAKRIEKRPPRSAASGTT